jgi:hypothetical protein
MTASQIAQQIAVKHDQGSTLIFNVPPNSTGVIPAASLAALSAFAAARAATFANPAAVLPVPVTAPCAGLSVTLPVAAGASFDMLMATEDMALAGQVIGGYSVEMQLTVGGPWTLLPVHGVTIGSRIVDVLPAPITGAVALRFNCTSDLTPPTPAHVVNAAGSCLGIPAGEAFPCWSDANFALCPLVATDCATAGAAGTWTVQGGAWFAPVGAPSTPAINVDCNNCAVGTHAKLVDCGPNCRTSLELSGEQILVTACPGMCLTNGTAGGALPSCAGSEPWSDTMIHLDACTEDSTRGWVRVPLPPPVASAVRATLASFGAYLQVAPTLTLIEGGA